MKIIFLDIDGVLNGYGNGTKILYNIFSFLHLRTFFFTYYDIFGIHRNKVRRLSRIIKKTGAKVVITSSWRHGWYIPYEDKTFRNKKLHDEFKRFNIPVIGITDQVSDGKYHSVRELEIQKWLSDHSDVNSFVILDDEKFDLKSFIGKELILTSYGEEITGAWYENTGLKNHHIKQAIKILNK